MPQSIRFLILFIFSTSLFYAQQHSVLDTAIARKAMEEADRLTRSYQFEAAMEKVNLARQIYTAQIGITSKEVAKVIYQVGVIEYYKGNYQKAQELGDSSLRIRLEVLGAIHKDVAASYNLIGNACQTLRDSRKAVENHQKALDIWKETLGPTHWYVGMSYNNLATDYIHLNETPEAIALIEEGMQLMLKAGAEASFNLASSYNLLGTIYYDEGDYQRAILFIEKALSIWLDAMGAKNAYVTAAYNNIGASYIELGDYEKAIEYYEKTLAIRLKILHPLHSDVAGSYNNLGAVYRSLNDYEKALDYYEKALTIRLKAFSETHPYVAASYNNIGRVYYLIGKYQLATQYTNKALQIGLHGKDELPFYVASSYHALGDIEFIQGHSSQAIDYYKKALPVLLYSPLDSLSTVLYPPVLIKALTGITSGYKQWYEQSGESDKLYQSKYWVEQAIEALNDQAQSISRDSKYKWAEDAVHVYELALQTNQLLFQLTDSMHYWQESFALVEKSKAYILLETLKDTRALQFAGIPDSLLKKEKALRQQIGEYEKQRQQQLIAGRSPTDTALATLNSQLFNTKNQYEQLKRLFETNYSNYYRLKYDFDILSLEATQQIINSPERAIISFFEGDNSLFTLLVLQDTFIVTEQRIDEAFPLGKWVSNMTKGLFEHRVKKLALSKYAQYNQQYAEAAFELHQKLMAPLNPALEGIHELIILPDGKLGYIPFEALLKALPEDVSAFRTYDYLIKDYQISYAYSATLLKEMQLKEHQPLKTLLAMAPNFPQDTNQLEDLVALRSGFTPLRFNKEEINAIQNYINGDLYEGSEANLSLFLDIASQYKILHLSTHGKVDDRLGDYSFLTFSPGLDSTKGFKLYLRDLYNLSLNADMVVLSACDTGIGELKRGEGILSLARGFAYAGSKSIINTLWSVDDQSSMELMTEFYKNLKKGESKGHALRNAKLHFLQNHLDPSPFYWAAFIPVGDMQALTLWSIWDYKWWIIGLFIISIVYILWRRIRV